MDISFEILKIFYWVIHRCNTSIQTFYLLYSISIFNKVETSFIEDKDSILQNKVLKISCPNHLLWSCCEWSHKHERCNSQCYYPNVCKILYYAEMRLQHSRALFNVFPNCLLQRCKQLPFLPLRFMNNLHKYQLPWVNIVDQQVGAQVTMSIHFKAQVISYTSKHVQNKM